MTQTPPQRRLTRAYDPDTETLELLDQLRRVNAESRKLMETLRAIRVQRTTLINQLRVKGLTHRRIAKEVGVSDSAIARLMVLPTDDTKEA